jgi:hypothetical protein
MLLLMFVFSWWAAHLYTPLPKGEVPLHTPAVKSQDLSCSGLPGPRQTMEGSINLQMAKEVDVR